MTSLSLRMKLSIKDDHESVIASSAIADKPTLGTKVTNVNTKKGISSRLTFAETKAAGDDFFSSNVYASRKPEMKMNKGI